MAQPFQYDPIALRNWVDQCEELRQAGIIVIDAAGKETIVRGGPRMKWVTIAPKGMLPASNSFSSAGPRNAERPNFWERWGGAVMSCGGAVATGAVIVLSSGTATPFVAGLALNSAALCGVNLGRGIAHQEWKSFQRLSRGAYNAWLVTETAMSLIDLCNGVKGAVGLLEKMKTAGRLARLQKAIGGKKLDRSGLLAAIRQIDPSFRVALKGSGKVSNSVLQRKAMRILGDAGFKNLSRARQEIVLGGIADAFAIGGVKMTADSLIQSYDVFVVVDE